MNNSKTTDVTEELLKVLSLHKQKPYLPLWGELFYILWNVKKKADDSECDLIAYSINPTGQLVYHHKEGLFVARLPECNVKMSLDELISMLLNGRFLPLSRNQHKQLS